MKQGRTLVELAQEIQRRSEQKQDYITDTRQLQLVPACGNYESWQGGPALRVNGQGEFAVSETTHQQLSVHINIPKKYYDTMRAEAPNLLALNVNHWLHEKPTTRMVRTLNPESLEVVS